MDAPEILEKGVKVTGNGQLITHNYVKAGNLFENLYRRVTTPTTGTLVRDHYGRSYVVCEDGSLRHTTTVATRAVQRMMPKKRRAFKMLLATLGFGKGGK